MAQCAGKAPCFALPEASSPPSADALPYAYVIEAEQKVRVALTLQLRAAGVRNIPFAELSDFLEASPALEPGCVVIDATSLERDAHQLREAPAYRVVGWPIIVMFREPSIDILMRSVRLGATDFLHKPCGTEDLIDVLWRAAPKLAVERFREASLKASKRLECLSERERAIAYAMLDGLSSKAIGLRLNISPRTVEMHRARLNKKVGTSSTAELVSVLHSALYSRGI